MWFWLSLIALLCWSGSDLFSKIGCQSETDKYSHLKMVTAVGVVMGLHAAYEIFIGGTQVTWDIIWTYLPVSLLYISSMAMGYIGLRYIELSISSPICNSSGALVAVLCLIAAYVALYKTRFGLRLRACGEHPQAADSVGINVYKMRYAGVILSGALGAVGGLAYIVPPVQTWNFEVGVAGAGFLALAVMIFGQWKPFHIFGAAMFFAVFKSLANIADSTFLAQLHWSSNIYNMMPFVASMVILAFTSKNSMAPKAEGIPYDKGSR